MLLRLLPSDNLLGSDVLASVHLGVDVAVATTIPLLKASESQNVKTFLHLSEHVFSYLSFSCCFAAKMSSPGQYLTFRSLGINFGSSENDTSR